MVGPLTITERRIKVKKYLLKRERRLKNRLEGKGHQYAGRTKFANARRRVKGRFVTLEFMSAKGIKFDSEKPGWVCSTLDSKVFPTADEAVRAVDADAAAQSLHDADCRRRRDDEIFNRLTGSLATVDAARPSTPPTTLQRHCKEIIS